MRRLRVLVLMHPDCVPPDSTDGYTAQEINAWKNEFDVVSTLRAAGHDVRPLGVQEESSRVATRSKASSRMWCTLAGGVPLDAGYDQHIASFLELMKIPIPGVTRAA
jgi:D-alanine-D-alanine ligase